MMLDPATLDWVADWLRDRARLCASHAARVDAPEADRQRGAANALATAAGSLRRKARATAPGTAPGTDPGEE